MNQLTAFWDWTTKWLAALWDWTTNDPVSFYTAVLAVSTICLWIVTWRGIRNQSKDTRIIERECGARRTSPSRRASRRSARRDGSRSVQKRRPSTCSECVMGDGFGQRRFTSFCHRYNQQVLRKVDGGH